MKKSTLTFLIFSFLGAAGLSLALLIFSVTWIGRFGGAGFLFLSICLMICSRYGLPWRFSSGRGKIIWASSFTFGLLLLLPLVIARDSGVSQCDNLQVQHIFMNPKKKFPKWALGNLIPEEDQVSLGIELACWVLPEFDRNKAKRVKDLTIPLYQQLETDPCFKDLGSVMNFAYAELSLRSPDREHYVALLPSTKKPKASILFLHGSGGNFSCYWYALAPLAKEKNIAVFFPSFGFGNWDRRLSEEVITKTRKDIIERFNVDPKSLYLAALSNGGPGAVRTIAKNPANFQGLILLSAVPRLKWVEEGNTVDAWKDLPIYFTHGADDLRVPIKPSKDQMDKLKESGARISSHIELDEDHFLLFSKRAQLLASISDWIDASKKE